MTGGGTSTDVLTPGDSTDSGVTGALGGTSASTDSGASAVATGGSDCPPQGSANASIGAGSNTDGAGGGSGGGGGGQPAATNGGTAGWSPGPGLEACAAKNLAWVAVNNNGSGACGDPLAAFCCTAASVYAEFPMYAALLKPKIDETVAGGLKLYHCSTSAAGSTTLHFAIQDSQGVHYKTLYFNGGTPSGRTPAGQCAAVSSADLGISAAASAGGPAAPTGTSTLGDLSTFLTIAQATLTIVKNGDLPGAAVRIKDLETAWDQAADQLKAADLKNWTLLDKAIDIALKRLRVSSPVASSCSDALLSLVAVMQTLAAGAPPRPLGELSAITQIAQDTLRIVATGDLQAAKLRVKDLETAWDQAQAVMEPMNETAWTAVDKYVDTGLHTLRASPQDAARCAEALTSLIAMLGYFNAPG